MYGKAYDTMYEGSMVGAGFNVFAVWNYCIAKNRSGFIELNPKLLAFVLGGPEQEIEEALVYLLRPDPKSRTKDEDGRRLVREGEYQYRMVNWGAYDGLKSKQDQREYNKRKQAEYRERQRVKKLSKEERAAEKNAGHPIKGEVEYLKAAEQGAAQEKLDEITTGKLPRPLQ